MSANAPGDWIWSQDQNNYYRIVFNPTTRQNEYVWAPVPPNSQVQPSTQDVSQAYASHVVAQPVTDTRTRADSVLVSGQVYEADMAPSAPADTQLRFQGTPHLGRHDRLDPRYYVRGKDEASSYFKIGRVFALLWAESASATIARNGTENTAVTIGRFGENVYSQIRRFVVVKVNRQRHFVYACAIWTYNGQGTLKRGCNANEHTIVYLDGTQPQRFAGEWERGMTKDPIMIQPSEANEQMDPASRLRCGKMYSIEWNVKLKDIGMVASHHRTKLLRYFNEGLESGFDPDDDDYSSQPQQLQPAPQNFYASSSQQGYRNGYETGYGYGYRH